MDKFFASIQNQNKSSGTPPGAAGGNDSSSAGAEGDEAAKLPKGVVLGKDGKPCRSCMSVRDWMAMAKREGGSSGASPNNRDSSASSSASSTAIPSTTSSSSGSLASAGTAATAATVAAAAYPADCPPDVDTLGTHTWTFLHSLSASYPEQAGPAQQADMRAFLTLFGRLYPCWVCAEDFTAWMAQPGNQPRVQGREALGAWMCAAHNEVNRKLGKEEFDCARWRERWRDGWRDGRCG